MHVEFASIVYGILWYSIDAWRCQGACPLHLSQTPQSTPLLFSHRSCWLACSSLALIQHLDNVSVQPVPLQGLRGHAGGTTDPPLALLCPTGALKRLIHVPLGAGVEESEGVADLQWLFVDHAHFHATHVEHETGRTGVVAKDQVRVELDVAVATSLDAGVGLLGRGGAGDLGEEGARGEIDEGLGATGECLGAAIDVETVGMSGRRQFGAQGRDGGERFSGGGHFGEEKSW